MMETEEVSELDRELEGAKKAGKAPQFVVKNYNYENQGDMSKRKLRQRFYLALLLDDRIIEKKVSRVVDRAMNGKETNQGRLMFFEIIDEAFQEAVKKRWPRHVVLKDVRVEMRALHAIYGSEQGHQTQICLCVIMDKKERSIRRYGADSTYLIVETLADVYCWVAWRLLRRPLKSK